jgi:hypothetical protein
VRKLQDDNVGCCRRSCVLLIISPGIFRVKLSSFSIISDALSGHFIFIGLIFIGHVNIAHVGINTLSQSACSHISTDYTTALRILDIDSNAPEVRQELEMGNVVDITSHHLLKDPMEDFTAVIRGLVCTNPRQFEVSEDGERSFEVGAAIVEAWRTGRLGNTTHEVIKTDGFAMLDSDGVASSRGVSFDALQLFVNECKLLELPMDVGIGIGLVVGAAPGDGVLDGTGAALVPTEEVGDALARFLFGLLPLMVASTRHLAHELVAVCFGDVSMSAAGVVVRVVRFTLEGEDFIHVDVERWMGTY